MAFIEGLDTAEAATGTPPPIPEADYLLFLSASEISMKDGGKKQVKATFEVADGQHKGRKIIENLALRNPGSAENVRISLGVIKSLALAVGHPLNAISEDLAELRMKPIMAKVRIEKERTVGDKTYSARNRISHFSPRPAAGFAGAPVQPGYAGPVASTYQLPPQPLQQSAPPAPQYAPPLPGQQAYTQVAPQPPVQPNYAPLPSQPAPAPAPVQQQMVPPPPPAAAPPAFPWMQGAPQG